MDQVVIPKIVRNVFSQDLLQDLCDLRSTLQNMPFDQAFSRYTLSNINSPIIQKAFDESLHVARHTFGSNTLLPTYSLFAHYKDNAKLWKHKDDNACTYTLDYCVYQTEPWDIYVENIPYTLHENEALAFYGNDQEHWRGPFPNPESQEVAMLFFHYAEPDHWWFTKGPSYLSVIRKEISEKEWHEQNLS